MSQPVFSTRLEEDLVQRVGTKLHLEVTVEDQSEKVKHLMNVVYHCNMSIRFFLNGGVPPDPMQMMAGLLSPKQETRVLQRSHLFTFRYKIPETMSNKSYPNTYRTKASGPAQQKINMGSHRQRLMSLLKV